MKNDAAHVSTALLAEDSAEQHVRWPLIAVSAEGNSDQATLGSGFAELTIRFCHLRIQLVTSGFRDVVQILWQN
jgi:hypothetical protein